MLARIENGTVAERRPMTLDDVPAHKRQLWRPIVIEGDGPIQQEVIEADRVRVVRSHPPLDDIKRGLIARLDAKSLDVQAQYKTPGMDMIYQEKFAQAQAVEAMGKAAANALSEAESVAQFPTLTASVGIESPTLYAAAELVLMRYAQFAQLSMIIERARLSGKKAIADAQTIDAANAAYEAVTWPTP